MTPGSGSNGNAAGVAVQTARITVGELGYQPSRLTLRSGVPARITFVRTTDKTCGTDVVFPSLNIRRELPLNQSVDIEFTPRASGNIEFLCGMNMLRGMWWIWALWRACSTVMLNPPRRRRFLCPHAMRRRAVSPPAFSSHRALSLASVSMAVRRLSCDRGTMGAVYSPST